MTEHRADVIVIAVGTEPARPADIPFDDDTIIDTDGLLTLKHLPDSIVIVGGGVIGTEYASILAALSVPVTLIDKRPRLLEFVDAQIIDALQQQMTDIGVTLYHEEEVLAITKEKDHRIDVRLTQAKPIQATTLMYAIGRIGATKELEPGVDRPHAGSTWARVRERPFPNGNPTHLCRRRRHRLPGSGLHLHAARTPCLLPCLRLS